MKPQRLFPNYISLYKSTFVDYLRLVGKVSKVTEVAFNVGASFNAEYNLAGEVKGNLFFPIEQFNTNVVDFALLNESVIFADLVCARADILFDDEAEYLCTIKPLRDWAIRANSLLKATKVRAVCQSFPTQNDYAKFNFVSQNIDWQGFFIALSYVTGTQNATLSIMINKLMSFCVTTDIIE